MKKQLFFSLLFVIVGKNMVFSQQKEVVVSKRKKFKPLYQNSIQLKQLENKNIQEKLIEAKVFYERAPQELKQKDYDKGNEKHFNFKKEVGGKSNNKLKPNLFQKRIIRNEILDLQEQEKTEGFQSNKEEIRVLEFQLQSIVEDPVTEDQNQGEETQNPDLDQSPFVSVDSTEVKDPSEHNIGERRRKLKVQLKGPTQFDSRIEIEDLNPFEKRQAQMLLISESVAMVVDKRVLKKISANYYKIDELETLQERYNLCSKVSFVKQYTVGIGTSFVVGKKEMLTAAHVFQNKLKNYAIVFGYKRITKSGVDETIIPKKNVFFPKKVLKKSYNLDLVLFEVAREFNTLQAPLAIENSKVLSKNQRVYMIGHPSGLPQKAAVNARIIENKAQAYFYTTLDAFQGNSGSPVFDRASHKVIGVLVSGQLDYIFNGNCYEDNICSIPYCKGEKIVRIDAFFNTF